jgi:hypothetical protein
VLVFKFCYYVEVVLCSQIGFAALENFDAEVNINSVGRPHPYPHEQGEPAQIQKSKSC